MFKKFKSLFSRIGNKISAGYKSFTESFEPNVTFNKETGKVEFKVKGFKKLVTRTLYQRAVYKARKYQKQENALIKRHQHKITTSVDVGGRRHKNTLTVGEFAPSKLPSYSDVNKVKIRYKADYWDMRDKMYRDNFIKAVEYAGSVNNVDMSAIVKMIQDMRISEFKAMMYTPANQFTIFHNWYEGSIDQLNYMIDELRNMIAKYSGSGYHLHKGEKLSRVETHYRTSMNETQRWWRVETYRHPEKFISAKQSRDLVNKSLKVTRANTIFNVAKTYTSLKNAIKKKKK